MNDIEIMRAGEFTAMSGEVVRFSASDLDAVAANYNPERFEAPLVVGHPAADAPSYGWVKRVRRDGDRLHAMAADVDPAFAEIVKAGRYRKVSASLFKPTASNNPTPGAYYLRHVGFLGAVAPAISGLKPVSFAGPEDEYICFGESPDELRRFIEKMQAKTSAETFVSKLLAEGRVLPRDRDLVVNFMSSLDEAETVSFADGEGNLSLSQAATFKRFLSALPPQVHYGELTADRGDSSEFADFQGPEGIAIDRENSELHKAARALQHSSGVPYQDAVMTILRQRRGG